MAGNSPLPRVSPVQGTRHVVTLTPFYPTSADDARGCFVAASLPALHDMGVRETVFAVQPWYRAPAHTNSHVFQAEQIRYPALPSAIGLASAGAFLFARLVNKIRRLHSANPINVIHAHAALPCGHAAALLSREFGIPYVVTVHGLDAYFTNQVQGRAGKWCRSVARFVYGSADSVICVSDKVREKVLEAASPGIKIKTEVVYNGVDLELFYPPAEISTENHAAGVILSVGNLIPTKGHELVLRAFADVRQQFPDVCCEIIGDGPERVRLGALARELNVANSVTFRGKCSHPEVAEAMRHCTLFVLPSSYEGLGCVYLEAMASGKVAIGCRGQGIEEIIEHGANGWLIHPGDQQELKESLLELLEDAALRREIGIAARSTMVRNFTVHQQAEHLFRIYQACAR